MIAAALKFLRTPIYLPRPTLDFYLDIGVARAHTALWREALHMDCREYVVLHLEVWRKEIFRLRLYETGMSLMSRKAPGKFR